MRSCRVPADRVSRFRGGDDKTAARGPFRVFGPGAALDGAEQQVDTEDQVTAVLTGNAILAEWQ